MGGLSIGASGRVVVSLLLTQLLERQQCLLLSSTQVSYMGRWVLRCSCQLWLSCNFDFTGADAHLVRLDTLQVGSRHGSCRWRLSLYEFMIGP